MAVVLIPFTVLATLLTEDKREYIFACGATLSFVSFVMGV